MDDTWKDKLEFNDTEPVLDLSQMQMLLFLRAVIALVQAIF